MTGARGSVAASLAAVHAEAFDAPWDAAAFAGLADQPGVDVIAEPDGFILIRTAADEAEVLTLAVRPAGRRQGLGRRLLDRAVAAATARGARSLLLEVADDNAAALGLYATAGFVEAGRRPRYYARPDGSRRDALLLRLDLTRALPTP